MKKDILKIVVVINNNLLKLEPHKENKAQVWKERKMILFMNKIKHLIKNWQVRQNNHFQKKRTKITKPHTWLIIFISNHNQYSKKEGVRIMRKIFKPKMLILSSNMMRFLKMLAHYRNKYKSYYKTNDFVRKLKYISLK